MLSLLLESGSGGGTMTCVTLTVTVACFPDSVSVTRMSASPAETPVTSPLESTLATDSFNHFQSSLDLATSRTHPRGNRPCAVSEGYNVAARSGWTPSGMGRPADRGTDSTGRGGFQV